MDRKRVAVVKCDTKSVIKCVDYFSSKVDFILIGNISKTRELALELGVLLDSVELIDRCDDLEACSYGAQLASNNKIDVIMKGLVHTGTFMKSLLNKELGLLMEGNSLISLVSRFNLPGYHKPLYLTDCGINIEPDLEQKKGILKNAIRVVKLLGVDKPKVACICPVEVVNPKIKSTVDAKKLSMESIDGAIVEGPIAFDVAVSKVAADIKGINTEVSGDADILLFSNIDAGNAVYKSLSIFGKATISGIVAGLKLPVILTSRADSTEVKIASIQLALDLT